MAIKNAQYQIKDGQGFSIYHYETNSGQSVVLDANNNVLGTLDEFMFKGKVVNTGTIKDLKVSGLYRIKGLSGIPTGLEIDKTSILWVSAVGKTNLPDFINYQLISQNGDIFNKTVVGSVESSWSSGGTRLENSINTLISNFGELSALNTKAKGSFVNAINEVNTKVDTTQTNLTSLKTSYDDHNHDSIYIKKSGDTIEGNITLPPTKGFYAKLTDGSSRNMIGTLSNGDIQLGNKLSVLNLYSTNDLLHNGKKVWTEVNDGTGSGLDADLLDGLQGIDYAKATISNTFKETNTFSKDINVNGKINIGKYNVNYSEDGISFNLGSNKSVTITNDLRMNIDHLFMDSTKGLEKGIHWLSGGDEFALLTNSSSAAGELWMWHNTNKGVSERSFGIRKDSSVAFDKYIAISGRNLYIQGSQPSGSIPDGSIWIL